MLVSIYYNEIVHSTKAFSLKRQMLIIYNNSYRENISGNFSIKFILENKLRLNILINILQKLKKKTICFLSKIKKFKLKAFSKI